MESKCKQRKRDRSPNSCLEVVKYSLCSSTDCICCVCFEDLEVKYHGNATKHGHKILLWRQNEKTDACRSIEFYLSCELDCQKDLKCVCRPYLNKILKGIKSKQEYTGKLLAARKNVSAFLMPSDISLIQNVEELSLEPVSSLTVRRTCGPVSAKPKASSNGAKQEIASPLGEHQQQQALQKQEPAAKKAKKEGKKVSLYT